MSVVEWKKREEAVREGSLAEQTLLNRSRQSGFCVVLLFKLPAAHLLPNHFSLQLPEHPLLFTFLLQLQSSLDHFLYLSQWSVCLRRPQRGLHTHCYTSTELLIRALKSWNKSKNTMEKTGHRMWVNFTLCKQTDDQWPNSFIEKKKQPKNAMKERSCIMLQKDGISFQMLL